MTPDLRAQWKQLAEGATPGWYIPNRDPLAIWSHTVDAIEVCSFNAPRSNLGALADAEFIVAARTAVPELLDALEAAEARATAAEEALAPFVAECDKVAIPHDAEGLVRHHRGNAGFAGAISGYADAREEVKAAEARSRALEDALREVVEFRRPKGYAVMLREWQEGGSTRSADFLTESDRERVAIWDRARALLAVPVVPEGNQ